MCWYILVSLCVLFVFLSLAFASPIPLPFTIYMYIPHDISTRDFISNGTFRTRSLTRSAFIFETRQQFLNAYFEGTVDWWCSLIAAHLHMWCLSTFSRRPPTTAVMASICPSENTFWEVLGLPSSIWCSKWQPLDKRQWEFACRLIARLTADWSLTQFCS